MRLMNNPLIQYQARYEQALYDLVNCADIPAQRIKEAMLYTLFPAGKRLRPMLVYLCGELLQTDIHALDIIAVAIELMHTFSLVHDDLPAMDNDDLRRGRPSCHRAFDEATAILVGDGMQALSIDILLCELPKSMTMAQVVTVTRELVLACGPAGMVSGQSLDMTELTQVPIQEAQLRQIHLLKTGKLILACINMVLAASQPTERYGISWAAQVEALQSFALHLGLLFQMQDDYLDRFGQEDLLGKGRSSDSANQKQTFATICDQPTLLAHIQHHLHQAQQSLGAFGEKATHLQALLIYLSETRGAESPA